MRRKVLKVLIVLSFIITMIATDFVLLGYNVVNAIETENEQQTSNNTEAANTENIIEENNSKLQIQATKEIYKGYMYANSDMETQYYDLWDVKINTIDNQESIIVSSENSVFINRDNLEFDANQSVKYKRTIINKESMKAIFGEEGFITIYNSDKEIIGTANNDSEVDENDNIILDYDNITNIQIATTKPLNDGNLRMCNQKIVLGQTGYTKEELKTFTKINTQIKLGDAENTEIQKEEIMLNDTKTDAEININKVNLSTIQENQDIQIGLNLRSDSNEYDFYKNPVLSIEFPKECETLDVKSINLLYTDEIHITAAKLITNNQGNKVIEITTEGEQTKPCSTINKGIYVNIDLNITLDKLATSKQTQLKMKYTNDNNKGQIFETSKDIEISAKTGLITYAKAENFDRDLNTAETINSQPAIANLNVYSEERIVNLKMAIVNNYENDLQEVSIIGRIPMKDDTNTFNMNLQNAIQIDNPNIQIYYSNDLNAVENSDTWIQDIQDFNEVKSYKIILNENVLKAKDKLEFGYNLIVPENMQYNQYAYTGYTVNYKNQNAVLVNTTKICFKTDTLETVINTEQNTDEINNQSGISNIAETGNIIQDCNVSIQVTSADTTIKNGDIVKEGQNLKYTIKLTNTTDKTLTNLKLIGTNTNAIYYGELKYETEGVSDDSPYKYNIYYREDPSLKQKDITIDDIEPGMSKVVEYEISIKELVDGETQTEGKFTISANNYEEVSINTYTNPIVDAELKVIVMDRQTALNKVYHDSDFPISVDTTNLTNTVQNNVIVEIKLPEIMEFNTKGFYSGSTYEFVSYDEKTNTFKVKIYKIEPGETITFGTLIYGADLGENKTVNGGFFAKATTENSNTYKSNTIYRDITQIKSYIKASQTTNLKKNEVKNGDQVTYTSVIENVGDIDEEITLLTALERGQTINDVYYIYNGVTTKINIEDIIDRTINFKNDLKAGEQFIFVETVTIDSENSLNQEITNKVIVDARFTDVDINDVVLKITDYIKPDSGNDDDGDDNDGNNSGGSDNGGDNNTDNKGENGNDNKYSIAGTAWIDENKNGMRENSEEIMQNKEVILVSNDSQIISKTNTNSDGKYVFKNLADGKYIVIFLNDFVEYRLTDYQKNGINQNQNSDVILSTITLNGESKQVAITDIITLNNQDASNIDAGFIKNEKFDISLNKTINNIIVKNSKASTSYSYNNVSLAKVEVDSKYIDGTTVTINYVISITNNGEVAGYVGDIIDYIPEGMQLTNKKDSTWYVGNDGYMHCEAISNDIIKPGQTKNVELQMVKSITKDNVGIVSNTAKIGKMSNELGIIDGNSEDDTSKVDAIISIKTGEIIIASLVTFILSIIVLGVYIIKNKILKERR